MAPSAAGQSNSLVLRDSKDAAGVSAEYPIKRMGEYPQDRDSYIASGALTRAVRAWSMRALHPLGSPHR